MSGYERPTERGSSPTKILFWATLSHDVEGAQVSYSWVSPSFGTQAELTGWLRVNRNERDEISAWKRTIRGADFDDERLSTRDDPKADPARLRALMQELADLLDAKKRELDRHSKRAA